MKRIALVAVLLGLLVGGTAWADRVFYPPWFGVGGTCTASWNSWTGYGGPMAADSWSTMVVVNLPRADTWAAAGEHAITNATASAPANQRHQCTCLLLSSTICLHSWVRKTVPILLFGQSPVGGTERLPHRGLLRGLAPAYPPDTPCRLLHAPERIRSHGEHVADRNSLPTPVASLIFPWTQPGSPGFYLQF